MPRGDYTANLVIGARTNNLKRGLKDARGDWDRFGKGVSANFTNVAKRAGLATAAIVAGLTASVKASANFADEIGKASRALGFASDEYQRIAFAIERVGGNLRQTEKAMLRFQQALAGISATTYRRAFEALGLEVEKLKNLRPEEAFNATVKGLSQVENVIERTAKATDIFGARNAKAILLLADNIDEYTRELNRAQAQGSIVGPEAIRNSESLNDAISDISLSIKSNFVNGVALGIDRSEEWDEAIFTLGETVRAFGKILAATITIIGKFLAATGQFVRQILGPNTAEGIKQRIATIRSELETLRASSSGLTAFYQDNTSAISALERELDKLETQLEAVNKESKVVPDLQEKVAASFDLTGVSVTATTESIKAVSKEFRIFAQGQKLLQEFPNPDVKLWEEYRDIIESFGPGIDEYTAAQEKLNEALQAGVITQEEFREASKAVADAAAEASKEVTKEAQAAASDFTKIWDNAIKRIQDSFADLIHSALWEDGIRGFKDFTDTLIDIWKRTITELIAAWVTSGITRVIATTGLFGLGSTVSAASSAASAAGSAAASSFSGSFSQSLLGRGAALATSAVGTFGAGLIASGGVFGGLGASLAAGFPAFGGVSAQLFNIGANAAFAGGGVSAIIGAAIPAVAAALGVFSIFGGSLFGGKTRLRDSGIEVATRGERLNASQFADFKKSGGLFSRSKRFTRYSELADEALEALRDANRQVYRQTAETVEAFGLSAEGLSDFTTRVKISLKDLDEEAKTQAISEAFQEIQTDMLEFAIAANGLVIPAESASKAMEKITEAANLVQAAAEHAAATAAGRINTLGILQQSLVNASGDELQRLLEATNEEIKAGGAEAAIQIQESIQAELEKRAVQADQASLVGRILESAGVVVQGINDLTVLAQAATTHAFTFISNAVQHGGDAIAESTAALANRIATSAAQYVATLTSITTPSEQVQANIPQFQTGGIVPGRRNTPLLAVVHGGEEVIPVGGRRGESVTVNISQTVTGDADASALRALRANASEVATIIEDEILQRGSLV